MRKTSLLTHTNNIEHLHTINKFPVYMGCVDIEDIAEKDIFEDMIFDICKDTGIIQLRNTLSLDLTNKYSHNDGVGELWKLHNEKFSCFLKKFNLKNIVEIGGGSGKLANMHVESNPLCKWTIIDKNYTGLNCNKINVVYDWFDANKSLFEYDAVVHSHVFEHIHNPEKFLCNMRKNINNNAYHIFSVPNLYEWLKNKYTNCLNFEHTVFLTEEIIDILLQKCGFEIVDKVKYQDHSIFYVCKPGEIKNIEYKNNYENYKKLFLDFISYYENLIKHINNKTKKSNSVYLFGAHIFSQYLIFSGLDTKNIECILDNSKLKLGKRLYGTNLKIKLPEYVINIDSPQIIVIAGTYTEEIKVDIQSKINATALFL